MKLNSSIAAVVTGGASGLGAATARALAAHGVKVAHLRSQRGQGRGARARRSAASSARSTSPRKKRSTPASPRRARPTGRSASWSIAPAPAMRSRPSAATKTDGSIKHFPIDAFNMIIQINLVGTFRCIAKSAAGMLTLDPLAGRRARRDRQHRLGRGRGRPDRPGRLYRLQGRRRRHDPADRARPAAAKASGSTPSCPASSTRR